MQMRRESDWVVRFYNQRGTAEQHIKEGKYAFRWTRLSRHVTRQRGGELAPVSTGHLGIAMEA